MNLAMPHTRARPLLVALAAMAALLVGVLTAAPPAEADPLTLTVSPNIVFSGGTVEVVFEAVSPEVTLPKFRVAGR